MLLPHGLAILLGRLNSDPKNSLLTIVSESGKEKIDVNLSHLLFIQAEDNYVKVITSERDKKYAKLIRQTLTNVESQLKEFDHLKRVHRSFIVNINNARSIERKKKSGTVYFDYDEFVPISQKYLNNLD